MVMFFALHPMRFIFLNSSDLQAEHLAMPLTSTHAISFSNKAIGIINFAKLFLSKFHRLYYDLISKFNIGLKSLLHQGLSEPESYDDLVYKLFV